MGEFIPPSRDLGCDYVLEYLVRGKREGVIWKHEGQEFYNWALGDGTLKFGVSTSLDEAKTDVERWHYAGHGAP